MLRTSPRRGLALSAALLLAAFSFAAHAQNAIQQLGPFAPNHVIMTPPANPNGQVMDGGDQTFPGNLVGTRPSGLSVVNPGLGICDYSNYTSTTNASYHSACFGWQNGNFVLIVDGVGYPIPGTIAAGTVVPNNTILMQLSSTSTIFVTRLGFAVPGDAPPLGFIPSTSACTINAGAGDGGSQVRSADGNCWLAQFPASGAAFTEWGADPKGLVDATAACNVAASVLHTTKIPLIIDGLFAISSPGCTFPAGAQPIFSTYAPTQANVPALGSRFVCNNQQSYACITMTAPSGTDLGVTSGASGLTIEGTPGQEPVSGSLGLLTIGGIGNWLDKVAISNMSVCMEVRSSDFTGYFYDMRDPHLEKCPLHSIVLNGAVDIRFWGGVLGDTGDYAYSPGSSTIEFKNNACVASGCGPNTVWFYGTQIEYPGISVLPACVFSWDNWNGHGVTDNYRFIGVHVEAATSSALNVFCSDPTITKLSAIQVTDSLFTNDAGPVNLFALNTLTALQFSSFDHIYCGGICDIFLFQNPASGRGGVYRVVLNDLSEVQNFSLTAAGVTNNATFSNSWVNGGRNTMAIGGYWDAGLTISNITGLGGDSLVDTAQGVVYWNEPWQNCSGSDGTFISGKCSQQHLAFGNPPFVTGWSDSNNRPISKNSKWRASDAI